VPKSWYLMTVSSIILFALFLRVAILRVRCTHCRLFPLVSKKLVYDDITSASVRACVGVCVRVCAHVHVLCVCACMCVRVR